MIVPEDALELARQFRQEALQAVNSAHRAYAAAQRSFFVLDRAVREAEEANAFRKPEQRATSRSNRASA